jgi:hypothetical protein
MSTSTQDTQVSKEFFTPIADAISRSYLGRYSILGRGFDERISFNRTEGKFHGDETRYIITTKVKQGAPDKQVVCGAWRAMLTPTPHVINLFAQYSVFSNYYTTLAMAKELAFSAAKFDCAVHYYLDMFSFSEEAIKEFFAEVKTANDKARVAGKEEKDLPYPPSWESCWRNVMDDTEFKLRKAYYALVALDSKSPESADESKKIMRSLPWILFKKWENQSAAVLVVSTLLDCVYSESVRNLVRLPIYFSEANKFGSQWSLDMSLHDAKIDSDDIDNLFAAAEGKYLRWCDALDGIDFTTEKTNAPELFTQAAKEIGDTNGGIYMAVRRILEANPVSRMDFLMPVIANWAEYANSDYLFTLVRSLPIDGSILGKRNAHGVLVTPEDPRDFRDFLRNAGDSVGVDTVWTREQLAKGEKLPEV